MQDNPRMKKEKNKACVDFGRKVRQLREKQGYSQERFALEIEIHRTYIGGIERGERNPTLITIHKIAKALNVKPSELL